MASLKLLVSLRAWFLIHLLVHKETDGTNIYKLIWYFELGHILPQYWSSYSAPGVGRSLISKEYSWNQYFSSSVGSTCVMNSELTVRFNWGIMQFEWGQPTTSKVKGFPYHRCNKPDLYQPLRYKSESYYRRVRWHRPLRSYMGAPWQLWLARVYSCNLLYKGYAYSLLDSVAGPWLSIRGGVEDMCYIHGRVEIGDMKVENWTVKE